MEINHLCWSYPPVISDLFPCTCHAVGNGSTVTQISHDRNSIRAQSLCNYMIKMYWFKPEGSIGLNWLEPHVCCIVLCLGVRVEERWIAVCLLHWDPTPLGCETSLQSLIAENKTCHHLSVKLETRIIFKVYRDCILLSNRQRSCTVLPFVIIQCPGYCIQYHMNT